MTQKKYLFNSLILTSALLDLQLNFHFKKSKMNFKIILLLGISISCTKAYPKNIRFDQEASTSAGTERTWIKPVPEEEKKQQHVRSRRNDDFTYSIPGEVFRSTPIYALEQWF